jgi:hypothetical protein
LGTPIHRVTPDRCLQLARQIRSAASSASLTIMGRNISGEARLIGTVSAAFAAVTPARHSAIAIFPGSFASDATRSFPRKGHADRRFVFRRGVSGAKWRAKIEKWTRDGTKVTGFSAKLRSSGSHQPALEPPPQDTIRLPGRLVLLRSGGRSGGREHDNLGADRGAVVKIVNVFIRQADAAGRDIGADGPWFVGAVDAVQRVLVALPQRAIPASYEWSRAQTTRNLPPDGLPAALNEVEKMTALPRSEKCTLVLEAIGNDKVRVNQASLDTPLVILANQALEAVGIGKQLHIARALRSAEYLNVDLWRLVTVPKSNRGQCNTVTHTVTLLRRQNGQVIQKSRPCPSTLREVHSRRALHARIPETDWRRRNCRPHSPPLTNCS